MSFQDLFRFGGSRKHAADGLGNLRPIPGLVDVSGFCFFLLGEGEGGVRGAGGGGTVFIENHRGGPGRGRGAGRVSAANWGIFFWGRG